MEIAAFQDENKASSQLTAVTHHRAGEAAVTPPGPLRFQVALSFPGEHRNRVRSVAEALASALGKDSVLYDEWYKAEFARPNLDVYLPNLYHKHSRLLVFFLCGDYAEKEWCGLEWRASRDLLKQKQDDRLMFLRLDRSDISGLYSIDGFLDISSMADSEVAAEILKRLAIGAAQTGQPLTMSVKTGASVVDPQEYWQQRRQVPDTAIMTKIWSKPRWVIWIRPSEFRLARLQTLDQIRRFVLDSCVRSQSRRTYPWCYADSFETGNEWIAAEIDMPGTQVSYAERWSFFRSGQFVHNRAFDEVLVLRDRFHILDILDTVTGAFEFAARMAGRGILSPQAAISFDLSGVAGRSLAWPLDALGDNDVVGQNCWCQDEEISIARRVNTVDLQARPREMALEVGLDIYSSFGWADAPREHLTELQNQRFGPAKKRQ